MTDIATPPATSPLVEGRTGQWEVVIGLEVHAQVSSQAKLFPEHLLHSGQGLMNMYR